MTFNFDINLHSLQCIQPDDLEGGDEPYLWVYFVKVDGSTLHQRPNNVNRLSANVTVSSGPGRPGNLGELEDIKSNRIPIRIPANIGHHSDSLKPITITFGLANGSLRILMPGMFLAVALAIDEEATPRDAMEEAHGALKELIQQRVNDFFNELDIGPYALLAVGQNGIAAVQQAFRQQLATFITALAQDAVDVVIQTATLAVLELNASFNPVDIANAIAAGISPEDPIGGTSVFFTESTLINSNLSIRVENDLRQNTTSFAGAWYKLFGGAHGTLKFSFNDIKKTTLPIVKQNVGGVEEHALQRDGQCRHRGTTVRVQRTANTVTHQVFVNYPFVRYRYKINGEELRDRAGSLRVQTTVGVPEFDESKFHFINEKLEQREVTIFFQKGSTPDEPQFEKIRLWNNAADGSYQVMLTIEAVLTDGTTIPVGDQPLEFGGIMLEFLDNFFESYLKCIASWLKAKSLPSKQGIPANWRNPEIQWREYEAFSHQLATLVEGNAIEKEKATFLTKSFAEKRNLELKIGEIDFQ